MSRKFYEPGLEMVNFTSNTLSASMQLQDLVSIVFLDAKEEKEKVFAYNVVFVACEELNIFILIL